MWAFFGAFDGLQKTLLAVAAPATMLLVIECIMLLVGLGHGSGADVDSDVSDIDASPDSDFDGDVGADVDFDAGMDADVGIDLDGDGIPDADASAHDFVPHSDDDISPHHETGDLRWFTQIGVISFFAITGWAGLVLLEANLSGALAVIMAAALGVLAMYICAVVMRKFNRLNSSGNISVKNSVGKFAEVYLPITPARMPGGKVTLTLQGRFVELDAVADADTPIATGQRVVIMDVVDDTTVLVRAARK